MGEIPCKRPVENTLHPSVNEQMSPGIFHNKKLYHIFICLLFRMRICPTMAEDRLFKRILLPIVKYSMSK
jgi:hypothetical protein